MTSVLARIRSWLSGVRRGHAVNSEMEEEFRLHMELRAADLERGGSHRYDSNPSLRILSTSRSIAAKSTPYFA